MYEKENSLRKCENAGESVEEKIKENITHLLN